MAQRNSLSGRSPFCQLSVVNACSGRTFRVSMFSSHTGFSIRGCRFQLIHQLLERSLRSFQLASEYDVAGVSRLGEKRQQREQGIHKQESSWRADFPTKNPTVFVSKKRSRSRLVWRHCAHSPNLEVYHPGLAGRFASRGCGKTYTSLNGCRVFTINHGNPSYPPQSYPPPEIRPY